MFDVLLIGAGVSGVSCALVLGSAKNKPFAADKTIALITHQKASSLQNAIFNNAYGIPAGKLGSELLAESLAQLNDFYPHVLQIEGEKVLAVSGEAGNFSIRTNKASYQSKIVVIAIGAGNPFTIEGLENYIVSHQKIATMVLGPESTKQVASFLSKKGLVHWVEVLNFFLKLFFFRLDLQQKHTTNTQQ
jgi:thioredoxin reductase